MRKIAQIFITTMLALPHGLAQSHYPGQHADKIKIEDRLKPAVYAYNLSDVRLLDGRFKENMLREEKWILSINSNRLLHSFRTNAGVYSANEGGYMIMKKLGGWEALDCDMRGHSTGHILSGLALLYAATGDEQYKVKSDSLISGLSAVQIALGKDGYLSAFPGQLIDRNIAGQRVWAPWYTLHKLMAGLIDQYLYCNNQKALDLVNAMAFWAYHKLQTVTPQQRIVMLRNEFGGINDAFYNLYAITGNEQDKWLGDFFYHNESLDPLKEGKDNLEKKHANTNIPKLLGLTRSYEIQGKGDGDSLAKFFWQTVVSHHSFVTGSNSDQEHFFKPDAISQHLSGHTGESCNVYNMLKLTRHLYIHTLDMKYADYYEKALFNHILGQQDPQTGMVAYFLPMQAGAFKLYSTPDSSFWCCVGSGFENHAKYGEAIYYHSKDAVYINLFISSELNWKENGFKLKQETSFPESGSTVFTIDAASDAVKTLNIRYPSWAKNGVSAKINGKEYSVKQHSGSYIALTRKWKAGDKITVNFPMVLSTVAANDNPLVRAVTFGPIVLAGDMGAVDLRGREPFSDPGQYNDYYTYNFHVPASIDTMLSVDTNRINNSIQAVAGKPLTFFDPKQGITFKPLYDIHHERYVVYWDIKQL